MDTVCGGGLGEQCINQVVITDVNDLGPCQLKKQIQVKEPELSLISRPPSTELVGLPLRGVYQPGQLGFLLGKRKKHHNQGWAGQNPKF